MQQTELDPEQLEKRKKLWKLFGRQTKAGKELFNLYNLAEKPKIQYPKPKPRTQKQIQAEKEKMTQTKKCPQKTQIQYPELPKKEGPKYYPVDFIPKRKNQSVIREEIEEYYRRRAKDIPANRGVDRANLVKKLQDKFVQKAGILPKGAQLPGLDEVKFDEAKIKEQAKIKIDKKAQSFTNPIVILMLFQKSDKDSTKQNRNMKDQLDELFDQIVQEIDDRQAYLESIEHLEEPQLKQKIKKEMIERIAELQRITEIKKDHK